MKIELQAGRPDLKDIKKSLDDSKIIKRLPKEVWIGWISSLVEAYNMSIYSFIAPLLAPLLFKHASAWSAVFFSYSLVLAGSCLLYPAGAVYYGLLGDRQGRQKLCIYSTLGLGLATGMMGLAPIHLLENTAWVYFLVLIGAQHFFSGGEYHGSIVFSLEHGEHQKKAGLMSALSCLFAVFGLAAANGLATFSSLIKDELWIRICFFLGGAGGVISYLLKNYCRETPAFAALTRERIAEGKAFDLIRREWQTLIKVMLILAFFSVSYTFIFIFLPLIPFEQTSEYHFDTFASLIAYGLFLMAAGWLADRVGIEKILTLGLCLFSIALLSLSYLSPNLFIFQMILTPCACLVIGPIHSWMLHQFEIQHRCRGIFISAAVATSIFGGSTVPICLLIYETFHSLAICSLYPLAISLCAIFNLVYFRKSKESLKIVVS